MYLNTRYLVNRSVHGGFQKLIKHFLREHPDVQRLITYCDRDISPDPNNTVYSRNGWKLIKEGRPMLSYYVQKPQQYGRRYLLPYCCGF